MDPNRLGPSQMESPQDWNPHRLDTSETETVTERTPTDWIFTCTAPTYRSPHRLNSSQAESLASRPACPPGWVLITLHPRASAPPGTPSDPQLPAQASRGPVVLGQDCSPTKRAPLESTPHALHVSLNALHPPNTEQKSQTLQALISVSCVQREDFGNLYVNLLRCHSLKHFLPHYA